MRQIFAQSERLQRTRQQQQQRTGQRAQRREQQAFLEDAVAYLEAEPRIERYAWFSGRASNVANVDLLAASGQLTALGKAYVNAASNPECTR